MPLRRILFSVFGFSISIIQISLASYLRILLDKPLVLS